MKINDIIQETTSAGGIATVAVPLGGMQKRPNASVFANTTPKKKKKKAAAKKPKTLTRRNFKWHEGLTGKHKKRKTAFSTMDEVEAAHTVCDCEWKAGATVGRTEG